MQCALFASRHRLGRPSVHYRVDTRHRLGQPPRCPCETANTKGTLTTATASKCGPSAGANCYAFRDPPDYVRYLKDAGFTILNNANNHSMDFGPVGPEIGAAARGEPWPDA
jgi:Bacterial capsule synthesis protein PGA_cap